MFQNVGTDDVIELAAKRWQSIIQIRAGEFHGGRVRAVGPIDTGDCEAPLG